MPDTIDALFAFVAALAIAWLLVPVAEALAIRIGAIDVPRERSLHTEPTPRLSGMAILVAVLATGAIFLPWDAETRAILGGAAVISLVGMIDDLVELLAARRPGRREKILLHGCRQVTDANAEQSKRGAGLARQPLVEQRGRDCSDDAGLLCRRLEAALPGEGREIGAPDLHGDAARRQLLRG